MKVQEIAGLEDIKIEILRSKVISIKGKRNRIYRKAISELRKQGYIYIPIGKYLYKRITECTTEEIDKYVAMQITSLATQYKNTIKPLKNYVKDEHIKMLHEGGLFDYNELEKENKE